MCKQTQRCIALRSSQQDAQCFGPRPTSTASFQPIRAGVSRREALHLEGKNEGSEKTDINTNQKLELLREWAVTTSHLSQ